MNYLIIGKSCSGKTSAREYLQQQFGFKGFEASKHFKELLKNSMYDSAEQLFAHEEKDIVARRISDLGLPRDGFVISGFRTSEEIAYMKSKFAVKVITLYCSDKSAFARSQARGREGMLSFEQFYKGVICADYDLGLAKSIREYTDILIDNEELSSITFKKTLDALITEDRLQ